MNTATEQKIKPGELTGLKNILDWNFPHACFHISSIPDGDYTGLEIAYTDGISAKKVWNAVKHLQRYARPEICRTGVRIIINRRMSEKVRTHLLAETKTVFALHNMPKESDDFLPVSVTVGDYIRTIFKMRDF